MKCRERDTVMDGCFSEKRRMEMEKAALPNWR